LLHRKLPRSWRGVGELAAGSLSGGRFGLTQGYFDAAIACYEALYKGDSNAWRIAANNTAVLLVTYQTDRRVSTVHAP
jgi:hypothetical protein